MSLYSQLQTKLRNVVNKVRRPSDVTKAQKNHVLRFPKCAACGSESGVQGHHIIGYNKRPDLAAEPTNLISLCESVGGLECHLRLGHAGDFHFSNENIVQDAADFLQANDAARRIILARAKANRVPDVPTND